MSKKVMVLKGSQWLRASPGHEAGVSSLYNPYTDRYCCLGVHGLHCGLTKEQMGMRASPRFVVELRDSEQLTPEQKEYFSFWTTKVGHDDPYWDGSTWLSSAAAKDAMRINDNSTTTDEEKVAALRPIFAQINITIDWRPNE